jgi:hypothetical protein
MDSNQTSSFKVDPRFRMGRYYFIAAIILLLIAAIILILHPLHNTICVKQGFISLLAAFFYCQAFTLFGFWLLIRKICINELDKKIEELVMKKAKLRYRFFYPYYLFVLAVLATSITEAKFIGLGKAQYFITSALLSFFLGFFVDSIPNMIEKLGKALT